MLVYTSLNETLSLSDTPMASGGEGEIHLITSKSLRFSSACVKIYFKPKRTQQLESKITRMVVNPPDKIYASNNRDNWKICWPLDVVYDNRRKFIGFIMPLAYENSVPLIALTSRKLSKKLPPVWSEKYDRCLGASSLMARLKLLCNIAIPIHLLHSTNTYVLKDFKPDNVLVTHDGRVTLVDMDSVQVAENGRLLYPGTAATPDYIPPEYYTRGVGKNIDVPIEKSWDYFAIGVVFYQILFGLHPYTVTPTTTADTNSNEPWQNIARNLFPFGVNASKISGYPPLHRNFKILPKKLKFLFQSAFSDYPNDRPSPEIWYKQLSACIKETPVPFIPQQGSISVQSSPSSAKVKMKKSSLVPHKNGKNKKGKGVLFYIKNYFLITFKIFSIILSTIGIIILITGAIIGITDYYLKKDDPVKMEEPDFSTPKFQKFQDIREKPKRIILKLPNGITKLELIRISFAGELELSMDCFEMGSPTDELGRVADEVQHDVILSKDYWLGKYEVTQAQYRAVMGKNPSVLIGDDLPVEMVTWNDAMEFCMKLTEIEKTAGRLPKDYTYTLPTEAQWEYACRAGTRTALNNGKNLTDYDECPNVGEVAWYYGNSGVTTHPVGKKSPNNWGLYDMHGNVAEWCLNWYGNYSVDILDNIDPLGPNTGEKRILRGGSWLDDACECRSGSRDFDLPSNKHDYCGFRVALVSENSNEEPED